MKPSPEPRTSLVRVAANPLYSPATPCFWIIWDPTENRLPFRPPVMLIWVRIVSSGYVAEQASRPAMLPTSSSSMLFSSRPCSPCRVLMESTSFREWNAANWMAVCGKILASVAALPDQSPIKPPSRHMCINDLLKPWPETSAIMMVVSRSRGATADLLTAPARPPARSFRTVALAIPWRACFSSCARRVEMESAFSFRL
mmetsp:Transcript_709/g.2123  ORF Transcript_709/g.2123 Transcript_709/m.2123 type:complete len:200 (+) Transcript_709:759-1358(+)